MPERSRKRSFNSFSEAVGGSAQPLKKQTGEPCLPGVTDRSLQRTAPLVETSVDDFVASTDVLYDYPGLEEDMFSIFENNSSFQSSTGGAAIIGVNCDPYFLTVEDLDSAFEELVQPAATVFENQGRSPRSREDYVPSLQYSSPDEQKAKTTTGIRDGSKALEEDIDWDLVMNGVEPFAHRTSVISAPSSQTIDASLASNTVHSIGCGKRPQPLRISTPLHEPSTSLLLRPFKTFFRISDMLSTKAELYKNQPRAVFELFARVIYTSRDRNGRKQYFQLRDLIAQTPPFLSGTLVN
jgi:hypothetical protein